MSDSWNFSQVCCECMAAPWLDGLQLNPSANICWWMDPLRCAFHRTTGGSRAEAKTDPRYEWRPIFKNMQKLQLNISAHLEVTGGGVIAWCGWCYAISTSLVSENNQWAQHCVRVSLGQPVFPCLVSNDGHPLLSFTSQGSQSRVAWWLTSLQLMTTTAIVCVCD